MTEQLTQTLNAANGPPSGTTAESTLADTPTVVVTGGTTWDPQGPFTTRDPFKGVEGLDPQGNPIAGAVNVVAVHPNNPDIAYIATPNGGIWKTNNFTTGTTTVVSPTGGNVPVPSPTWTPIGDQNDSLSISALTVEQDPNDASKVILYAGTGNTSSSNDAGQLIGVLRSSDDGATWTPLGGESFRDLRINNILA